MPFHSTQNGDRMKHTKRRYLNDDLIVDDQDDSSDTNTHDNPQPLSSYPLISCSNPMVTSIFLSLEPKTCYIIMLFMKFLFLHEQGVADHESGHKSGPKLVKLEQENTDSTGKL